MKKINQDQLCHIEYAKVPCEFSFMILGHIEIVKMLKVGCNGSNVNFFLPYCDTYSHIQLTIEKKKKKIPVSY